MISKESVISVFYSRLSQSFDQNTKQDKTLCLRVSSKNKENIILQSHLSLSLSLFIQKMFSAPAQIRRNRNWIQGQWFLMWKEKRFNVFSATLWAKQKVILISLTPRDYQLQFIVSCLRPIKLSTLFSHELLAFISVSRHFWSHHPNKACLFLKGLPAKKLNLVIVILFPLRKKYISGSVNVANSVIRKSCNSKQSNDICGELPNWNKFLIWTAKY